LIVSPVVLENARMHHEGNIPESILSIVTARIFSGTVDKSQKATADSVEFNVFTGQ
jgi:hypothetical protein